MTTIDHISLGVADVPSARAFYGVVLDVLGVSYVAEGDGFAAFGRDRVAFLLLTPSKADRPARATAPTWPSPRPTATP